MANACCPLRRKLILLVMLRAENKQNAHLFVIQGVFIKQESVTQVLLPPQAYFEQPFMLH